MPPKSLADVAVLASAELPEPPEPLEDELCWLEELCELCDELDSDELCDGVPVPPDEPHAATTMDSAAIPARAAVRIRCTRITLLSQSGSNGRAHYRGRAAVVIRNVANFSPRLAFGAPAVSSEWITK